MLLDPDPHSQSDPDPRQPNECGSRWIRIWIYNTDSDPALFVSDFQDANKNKFLFQIFGLLHTYRTVLHLSSKIKGHYSGKCPGTDHINNQYLTRSTICLTIWIRNPLFTYYLSIALSSNGKTEASRRGNRVGSQGLLQETL